MQLEQLPESSVERAPFSADVWKLAEIDTARESVVYFVYTSSLLIDRIEPRCRFGPLGLMYA